MMPEKEYEESGLAKIGNAYFMVRSKTSGKTHAINHQTKLPYCGWKIKWAEWEPVDKLPDEENQPTCQICQRHYDDSIKRKLQEIKKELEESISEFLFFQVITKNKDDGLGRFVETVAKFVRNELKLARKRKEAENAIKKEAES